MTKPAKFIVGLLGAVHLAIMLAEMFAWDTMGARLMKTDDPAVLDMTGTLAFNQGLYNGFLAAGLLWSLFIADATWQRKVAVFFLGCVAVAGAVGAMTASVTILAVQTLPAVVGLALVLRDHSRA